MSDNIAEIVLPEGYEPSEDESYMGLNHRAFFRNLLMAWRLQLQEGAEKTVSTMTGQKALFADPTDRAALESDRNFELRARDRERKLINKIGKTIRLIEIDEYGDCEDCGVEIGIKRLQARPVTDLCIDCKTKEEHLERATASSNSNDADAEN